MNDAQVPREPGEPTPGYAADAASHPATEGDRTGLSAEEFSALAERFSAVAPLLRTLFPAKEPTPTEGAAPAPVSATDREKGESPAGETAAVMAKVSPPRKKGKHREALLCALKPYLSPERREMADYLIRVCRVYDTVRELI